jgi:hypothetical protein
MLAAVVILDVKVTDAELAELDGTWERQHGDRLPLGYALGRCSGETWVRFHSLPDSKRYADTEDEYAEILHRHYTVLRELGSHTVIWVITANWTDGPDPDSGNPQRERAHPFARHWRTIREPDDDDACFWQLYISLEPAAPEQLDVLLRAVADEQLVNVILADRELRWLYHPYDGGADIYARDTAQRDWLRGEHPEWLSKHPFGL